MKNYNIHNILKIRTNLENIFPSCFAEQQTFEQNDLIIKTANFKKINLNQFKEILQGIYINQQKKIVFALIKTLAINIQIKISFGSPMIIEISPSYIWFSKYILKMPVASLYPFEHFIKLITQILLLEKNYSFIIAAGLAINNQAVLISSFGGMGKTTTSLKLTALNNSLRFLGDDTLITDGINIFPYPKNMRFRKFGSPFFSIEKNVNPAKYFKANRLEQNNLKPKYIFFLEKNNTDKAYQITSWQALNKLSAIQNKIIPISTERMILSGFYQNFINLPILLEKQNEIIHNLIKNTNSFVLESNNQNYQKLINQIIK